MSLPLFTPADDAARSREAAAAHAVTTALREGRLLHPPPSASRARVGRALRTLLPDALIRAVRGGRRVAAGRTRKPGSVPPVGFEPTLERV